MPASDPLLSRELKGLQSDVSASQRRRRARQDADPEAAVEVAAPAPSVEQPHAEKPLGEPEDADAQKLREQVGEFIDEATDFFREAENHHELSASYWLTAIDAGFELVSGGLHSNIHYYSLTGVR